MNWTSRPNAKQIVIADLPVAILKGQGEETVTQTALIIF
jgi:hypothetical protein